jgi:hypothetical protein
LPGTLALSAVCFLITGLMGLPLIRMGPDNDCRPRFAVMFFVLSIFRMTAIVPTAATARKYAADSREQDDNAN